MAWWLLTNTTYGTWLPGDPRGSVTSVRDERAYDSAHEERFEHDRPGEEFEPYLPGLYRASVDRMRGAPLYFDLVQAELILTQFQETAAYRKWFLRAASLMHNHFHLVVLAADAFDPGKILADFKAYASRVLNARYGVPKSKTWWTNRGSKRKLTNERSLAAAVHYTLYKQYAPLVAFCSEQGRLEL